MTTAELTQALRTVLARLELVSTAPVCRWDKSGGDDGEHVGPTGGPGPVDRYRSRLTSIDAGLRRRLDSAEAEGHTDRRDMECVKAREWYHNARTQVLNDATVTLAAITGRDGEAPTRHTGKLDTQSGVNEAIAEDAPGKPADQTAAKLGVSVFVVRRRYHELGLYPIDGTPVGGTNDARDEQVIAMKARGLTTRQIAFHLKLHQTQVVRILQKVA